MRFIWRKLSLSLIVLFALVPVMGQVALDVVDTQVEGYPTSIMVPVVLNSPTDEIGGIQFDLTLDPAWVFMGEIVSGAVGYSADFTGDFNVLDETTTRVLFYNAANNNTIPTGTDTVMWLGFSGSNVLSAVIDMSISNMIISDGTGNIVESNGTAGGIQIGEVVSFAFTEGEADVLETVTLELNMDNDGAVGGFQLDVFDTPDYIDLVSVATTLRTDGFTVETSEVGSGTRILVYGAENQDIAVGTGAVLSVDFMIHYNAYEGYVGVNMSNAVATDGIGGEYWIAALDSGTIHVTPGYMEEPHNLIAISGLDSHVPLSWDPPVGPIPPTVPFTIEILTDNYPGETSWDLIHVDADTMVASIAAGELTNTELYTWDLDLAAGAYIFSIYDSFGDGICCGYGEGYYRLILDETEIASGGEFGASESFTFNTNDGRYNRIQYNYIVNLDEDKENQNYSLRDDYSLSFPIFIESGQFESPYQNIEIADIRNYEREIPVSAYNIYRTDDGTNFDLIASVTADELGYNDQDVANSTTYSYYVKADYSPEGIESGPSNTAIATPLEWIEIAISDGGALSGTTDTLDIFLTNETNISFFYFEISDIPNYFLGETILETDRTVGWSLDVVELPSGDMAVTGISLGTPLAAGDGAIFKVIVRGFSDEEGTATVDFTTASIVDMANNEMPWTSTSGQFHVTIETQTLFFGHAVGNPGEMVTVPFIVSTTQDVHGIQVFLTDAPNYLTGITIAPTTYIDFSNWTVDFSIVGEELRILFFDNTLSNPIPPGTGQIADIYFSIDPGAPVGTSIEILPDYDNLVVSDVNNLPMHTEVVESHIYAGVPEALFSVENITTPDANNMISFDITLNNTVPVYVLDVSLMDTPMNFNALSIVPINRFANGAIDGSAGEQADGSLSILGFDFATGITPGDGAIMTVEGQVSGELDMLLYFEMTSAADVNVQPLFAWKIGYGILPNPNYVGIEDEILIPTDFALHQNYPNPFNPTTMITYDLKEQSAVSINIFDLTGRQVRTLVSDVQDAGHRYIVWDATDNIGRDVSAGVYIYQIKAGNFSKTKKMLYLK